MAILLYLYFSIKYPAPTLQLLKIQKPAALFCELSWPGGRTAQKAFFISLFWTPSIAAIIEPTASVVASLLPG